MCFVNEFAERPRRPVRLLLINPNTSEHITRRMELSARRVLPADTTLTAITAIEGPQAVRSASDVAYATANVHRMAQEHGPSHDALLLGISLDCGLHELRAMRDPQPVIGMTEAACLMACLHGPRFGLLTLGAHMAPMYLAHVAELGLSQRLAGVEAPDAPQAFHDSPDHVSAQLLDLLTQAAQTTLNQGAQCVVLAGAVLCGYAAELQARIGRPVVDGMASAVLLASARLSLSAD
jgi:allantoin racemase